MKSKGFFLAMFLFVFVYSLVPTYADDNAARHIPYNAEQRGILFTQNKGQLVDTKGEQRPDILFFAQAGGAEVYFSRGAIHYVFRHSEALPVAHQQTLGDEQSLQEQQAVVRKQHRVDVEIVGANPKAVVEAAANTGEYTNYYLGHCPQGVEGVAAYARLVYKDVYPHIDLVFYTVNNQLKYDFVVHPGGDIGAIALRYNAADNVFLTEEGAVQAVTTLGSIQDERPFTYQERAEGVAHRQRVASRYDVQGNTIRFVVGAYDKARTLVIDPGVLWATYYGGINSEQITDVAVDKDDNVVITGYTQSPVFAATPGAFQDTLYGNNTDFNDAFIAKFTKDGQRMWATYLGGSRDDKSFGVAVDSTNYVIIAGQTHSRDLPDTLAAIDSLFGNSLDGFVFKFTRNGVRVWGTYFGGNLLDIVSAVAVNKNGQIFLTGTTTSDRYTFPLLNAEQQLFGGISDAFVASLSTGGGILWSTFYGGDGNDYGNDIAIDTSGRVYVAGTTLSTDLPETAGHFQQSLRGLHDAFILRTRSDGQFIWATYYGGGNSEFGEGVATDNAGNVFLAGMTNSPDFPLRNALQGAIAGDKDAFVVKMDSTGNRVWATYYGGDSTDNVSAIATNARGDVAVVGETFSTSFPVTENAVQRELKPASDPREPRVDAILFSLTSQGDTVLATYYGSTRYDEATSVTFDHMGNIIVGGRSNGMNLPVRNAYQATVAGFQDAFLFRYGCDVQVTVTPDKSPSFCTGGSVTLDAGSGFAGYVWNTGATGQSITVSTSGTFAVTVTDDLGCKQTATLAVVVHPLPLPMLIATTPTTFCQGDSVVLMLTKAYNAYEWSDKSTKATLVVKKSGTYTVTVTDGNGCKAVASTTVTVHAIPTATVRSTMDFGIVPACRSSVVDTISITNSGTAAFDIESVQMDGTEFSALPVVSTPIALLPGRKQTFSVRFQPSGLGVVQRHMVIRLSPCGKEYTIALRGDKQGEVSILSNVTTVDFGTQYVCASVQKDTSITVYNKGTSSITLDKASVPAPFAVNDAELPTTIAAGDSTTLTVQYIPPGTEGVRNGELAIPYTAGDCNDTLRLELHSLAIDAVLTTATLSLDFGSLNGCDDASTATLRINNNGTAGLSLTGLTGNDNFHLLGATPVQIDANAEREVVVEFRPTSEGAFNGTVKLVYSVGPCEKELLVAVQGRKQGISVTVDESIDFGNLVSCEQQSSTATFSISIGGQAEGEVKSVQVNGPFTTSLQSGEKIAGGSTKQYTVEFTPAADGNYTGTIVMLLEPCGIAKTITLQGRRSSADFALRQNVVDYGTHPVGTTATKTVVLRNTGTAVVWVEKIEGVIAPFAFVAPAPVLPAAIMPEDSLVVEIEYTATAGEQEQEVRFETNKPCALSALVTLRGRGEEETQQAGTAHIAIPTMLRADVHTKNFRIPIVLAGSSTLQQAGATSLQMDIEYDATLFALTSVNKGTVLVDTVHADGTRVLTLAIDTITSYQSGSTLAELVGNVLLGQSDHTALDITRVVWTKGNVTETQVSSGLLTVEGICEAGGQRLLVYKGGFGIDQITPNPVDRTPVQLVVHTVEEGATSLEVYSKEGRRVYAEQWYGRDEQRTITMPNVFSNGTYMVVLRSPTKSDIEMLVIMR